MPERKEGKLDQGPNELLFGHTSGLLSQEIREILIRPNLLCITLYWSANASKSSIERLSMNASTSISRSARLRVAGAFFITASKSWRFC